MPRVIRNTAAFAAPFLCRMYRSGTAGLAWPAVDFEGQANHVRQQADLWGTLGQGIGPDEMHRLPGHSSLRHTFDRYVACSPVLILA
jgi:hypothetical protein